MSKAWLASVLIALTLTGCAGHLTTSPLPSHTPTAAPTPTHTPTPTPTPTPEPTTTIADGTVATGTLEIAGSSSRGGATVTKAGDQFTFALTGYTPPASQPLLYVLTDGSLKVGDCAENNKYQIVMNVDASPEPHVFAMFASQVTDDPSYLSAIAVVKYPVAADGGGCSQPVLAVAPLHWSVPDVRPGLTVSDSGASTGAAGTVTSRLGVLADYRTAPGDTWTAVARRFGITADDLQYLNPIRPGAGRAKTAYEGQLLNLDKGHRGDSESRRFGN